MAETRAQGRIDSMGVLETPELYNYILETSVYPRESEFLKEIRDITATLPRRLMGTPPDSGQMISMLLELVGAKRTIEIGVFTGYSLLLTALTIPPDGKIAAIDVNRNTYEMGLPIIQKAKVDHKINVIESEALPVLNQLLNEENEGSFDFAYVDADKANYWNYHERLMKLVKVGGVVVYDDTLWQGTVAISEEETPERHKITRRDMMEFNKLISADPRVRIVHVPMGDGMTVCRRLL